MEFIELPNFGIAEVQLTQRHVDLLYKDLIDQAPEGCEKLIQTPDEALGVVFTMR